MPKIPYRNLRFNADSLLMIDRVNTVYTEYQRQGYSLTLRQVYYQCVSRDWLPNTPEAYDRLTAIVGRGRVAGLIDWHTIVDRTRNLIVMPSWNSPDEIVLNGAASYTIDKWERQPNYVEVWVEKNALAGIVGQACYPLAVPYIACIGYMSLTEMWDASQRILAQQNEGKDVTLIHLGDHDPSGKDMTRDIVDRLTMFTYGAIDVQRIALNIDQVHTLNLLPNPAKVTDSRAAAYIAEFGTSSWELDAMPPDVLSTLITEAVLSYRDDDLWEDALIEEDLAREQLQKVADNWSYVVAYAQEQNW
jgi:hypothetical protein